MAKPLLSKLYSSAAVLLLSSLVLTGCQKPEEKKSEPTPPQKPIVKVPVVPVNTDQPTDEEKTKIRDFLDAADGVAVDEKTTCANQICGEPAKSVLPYIAIKKPSDSDSEASAQFENSISPALVKYLDSKFESEVQLTALLEKARVNLKDVQLKPSEKAFANVIWAFSRMTGSLKAMKSAGGGKAFDFDDFEFAKANEGFSSNDRDFLKKYLSDVVNSNEFLFMVLLSRGHPFDYVVRLYFNNALDLKTSRATLGKNALDSVNSLRKLFPGMNFDSTEGAEALLANKELTPNLLENFKTTLLMVYLDRIVKAPNGIFLEREVPVKQIVADFFDKRFTSIAAAVADRSGFEESKKNALASCKANAVLAFKAAPTNEKLKKAESVFLETKKAANETIDTLALEPTMKLKAKGAVDRAEFSLPESREATLAKMSEQFVRRQKSLSETTASFSAWNERLIFLALYGKSMESKANPFETLGSDCDSWIPGGISDNTLTSLNRISLSWITVYSLKMGAGIAAHELGHVISGAISGGHVKKTELDVFKKIKDCLQSQHGIDAKTDTREEDFADMIAAKVLARFEKKGQMLANVGCLLIGQDEKRWGNETGLSLTYPKGVNDPHSAPFYRLLQIQMLSGRELPSACENIVAQHLPSAKLRCEL